jgi:HK97 family phage major capsid protein
MIESRSTQAREARSSPSARRPLVVALLPSPLMRPAPSAREPTTRTTTKRRLRARVALAFSRRMKLDHVLKQMYDRRWAAFDAGNEILKRSNLTKEDRAKGDALIDESIKIAREITEYELKREEEREAVERDDRSRRGGGALEIGTRGYAVTDKGGRIPILAREQRMANTVECRAGDPKPGELSIGRALVGAITGDWTDAEAERRALGTGSIAAGGVMVPDSVSAAVIDLARARSVLIAAGAGTLPMPTQQVTIAKVASDPTANWVAENVEIPETDGSFGGYVMDAKKIAARTRISIELAQDAPNAAALIEAQLAAVLGLALDRAGLRGTGAGVGSGQEPLGVRNWDGVQLLPTDALPSWSQLADAVRLIRLQNGPDRGLGIVYSPTSGYHFDVAVDDTGSWLAPPSVASPERNPHFVTTQIPENLTGTGPNQTEIYVGDFRNVIVGIRREIMIEVSRDADDAFKRGQVVIRAYMRADVCTTYPAHHVVLTDVRTSAQGI